MKKSILFAFAAILSFSSFAADVFSSYIESDGTQYIDLGYPLSSDMEVELCVTPLASDQGTYGLFGARSGHSDRNFSMLINYAMSVFNLDFNSSGYNSFRLAPGFTVGKRYRLWSSAAQRRCEQPGANVAYNINDTACSDTFTTAYNANVFEVGGTEWAYAKARVHLLRVLKGGALIHEYVPAYTNNTWGLLDRVGDGGFKKEATGNPLTGSLPASPQVAFARANWLPQPKYDYPVECLISSGKEYIDTGLLLTNVHVTSARFAYVNDPAVGGGATLGARDAIDTNKYAVFSTCATLQARQLLLDFYETRHTVRTYLESNLVYSVQLGRQGVYVDSPYGVLYNYVSPDPFLPTAWGVSRPAWIFGQNAADSTFPHPAMRLYEMAINRVVSTGSTPVRDYQPCVANGVACLYDRVTGTFLGNASGEGAFTAGPWISEPAYVTETNAVATVGLSDLGVGASSCALAVAWESLSAEQPYIESDGTQYIDLGFKPKSDMTITLDFVPMEDSPGPGSGAAGMGLFGARTTASERNISALLGSYSTFGHCVIVDFSYNNYNAVRAVSPRYKKGSRYQVLLSPSERRVTEDGSIVAQNTYLQSQVFETAENAYVFAVNGTTWDKAAIRLYSLTIEQNGSVIRRYLPSREGAVFGLRDLVGDGGFRTATNAGANPLKLGGSASGAQTYFTNEVVTVTSCGDVQFRLNPLKPGATYRCTVKASNGLAGGVTNLEKTFATVADAAPAGAALSLEVLTLEDTDRKKGTLRILLTRTNTAATDVKLVCGKTYGGADAANWEKRLDLGTFAADEMEKEFVTPRLPNKTLYVRVYTADGEWSKTIFIPETDFVPTREGLVFLVQ